MPYNKETKIKIYISIRIKIKHLNYKDLNNNLQNHFKIRKKIMNLYNHKIFMKQRKKKMKKNC